MDAMDDKERMELTAWLGDAEITDEQFEELLDASRDIAKRYPDPDEAEERMEALTTAYRIIVGETAVIDELAASLSTVRDAEIRLRAGLQQAALMTIRDARGANTEEGFARRVHVTRKTVRSWLGK